jgi:acyl-CoA synthetase (AMP-forming)/AMP-acid ligase II
VPDLRMGEVVLAIVECVEGTHIDEAEITDYCRARAANFRVPRHIRYISDWPYTGSGKVAKQELRERYLPEFDVQVSTTVKEQ